jgi:hypothetical protein
MNKILIAIFIASWLLLSVAFVTAVVNKPNYSIYDVNHDGIVNVFDLRTVAAYFNQTCPPAPVEYDFNSNNEIDIGDLSILSFHFS